MIATSPSESWLVKAAEWNLEIKDQHSTGRPWNIWEDDINEFFKFVEEETENSSAYSILLCEKLLERASAREYDPEHPDGLTFKNFVMG